MKLHFGCPNSEFQLELKKVNTAVRAGPPHRVEQGGPKKGAALLPINKSSETQVASPCRNQLTGSIY